MKGESAGIDAWPVSGGVETVLTDRSSAEGSGSLAEVGEGSGGCWSFVGGDAGGTKRCCVDEIGSAGDPDDMKSA